MGVLGEGLKALQGWEITADCLKALWDGPAGVEMDVQLLSSRFVSFRALSCIASVPGSSISPDPEPKALLSQISLTLCLTNTSYSLEVMAHTCNPSTGGRGRVKKDDCKFEPAWAT